MQERLRTYQAEHDHYKNRRMNNNKSNGFNTGRKSVNEKKLLDDETDEI